MQGKFVLYTYNITKLDKSKRVRFVYLLKGRRDETGIVKELGGNFLAPGCFIVPEKTDKEMTEIFKTWSVKPKRLKIKIE